KPILKGGKFKEKMLRILKLGSSSTVATMRVNQLNRIYRLATLITLVTSRSGRVAVWAGALNIAVRQKTLAMRTKGL
ncbi:unnamed protein product, partial [marine sediment metagenome]